jgi:hypothetical protein
LFVEFLPLFPIHSKPVARDFQVEVTIADCGLPQPFLQGFRAGRGDVMLYSPVDEAAALARPSQAIDGTHGGFR